MDNDNITVSRFRYESFIVLAITGWFLALLFIGVHIGSTQ